MVIGRGAPLRVLREGIPWLGVGPIGGEGFVVFVWLVCCVRRRRNIISAISTSPMSRNGVTVPIAMIESTRKRKKSGVGAGSPFDVLENAAAFATPDEFVLPDECVVAFDDAVVIAVDCSSVLAFVLAAAGVAVLAVVVLFAFAAVRAVATALAREFVDAVADAFVLPRDVVEAVEDAEVIAAPEAALLPLAVAAAEPAAFVVEVLFALAAA